MNRRLVYAVAIGSPVVPAAIYAFRFGGFLNAWFLSVLLGLMAFTWGCNQFVLATRPHVLVAALGKKRLRALHTGMPICMLAAAALHGILKVGLLFGPGPVERGRGILASLYESLLWGQGFRRFNPQVVFGELAWLLLVAGLLLTILFIAPGVGYRVKAARRLRALLFERTGMGYRRFRKLHIFWTALTIVFLLHILFASSTSFASNPIGATWLVGYLVACLTVFFVSFFRRIGTHPAHYVRAVRGRIQAAARDRVGA